MENEIISVKEESQGLWKTASIVSAVLCAIFFLIYWLLSNPFWVGIIRLGAFIFFALTILGILKVLDGPLQVSLSSSEELFLISYTKKDKVVKEEQFERETVKKVTTVKAVENPLYSYLHPKSASFKVSFTDTDRELYLFEFSGRPLLFNPESQQKINAFLRDINLNA